MIRAIELLRQGAEKLKHKARTTRDSDIQGELYDMAAKWHWLAGETANLNDRVSQLEDVSA